MGKGREFTFKEKLEIISLYESLVTSGMKISRRHRQSGQISNLILQFRK